MSASSFASLLGAIGFVGLCVERGWTAGIIAFTVTAFVLATAFLFVDARV